MGAIQPRKRLHCIAIHHWFIEKHAGEQWLVESRLELVGHDHQPVVIALEPFLDQLPVLQFVDCVLADRRIGFRMHKIREGVERLVIRAALFELFLDDLEIPKPGDAGGSHDHRLGPPVDERHHVLLEDAQHHLGLILNEAIVLKRDVLQRLGYHARRIQLLLLRLRHDRAMQVVERLVRNDTGRHVHDVAFNNGFGLAVGVEWLAE